MVDDDGVERHAAAVHRRDAGKLLRFALAVGIVVALVVVGMDNRGRVRVGYGIGHANAPIWMVIVSAGLAGVIVGWLIRHRPTRTSTSARS